MAIDFDIQPRQHGKGGFFWNMRKFMLNNLGIEDESPATLNSQPAQILFATNSSTREPRASFPLDKLMSNLQSTFDTTLVNMTSIIFHQYPIEEQVKVISRSKAVFMAVGGSTFPCIFLPRDSHLVLFYDTELLDWDYWNNISHLRVHWIPYQHMDDPNFLSLFEALMQEML